MRGKVLISLVVVALVAVAGSAYSGEFPTKPITLQLPVPPGGSTDAGARILASYAEKKIGQPIVVISKPGANNQVGNTELSRQKPDGYYIGYLTCPTFNTNILDPSRKAIFTLDSFAPIINQVVDSNVVWVKADSPYKTLKDVLDDARKRPGEVRAGTGGVLSDDHLALLMLEEATKLKFRAVHFDGGAETVAAGLGGHTDISLDNVGTVANRVKGGEIRVLVVMHKERSKFLPDVPSSVELGYPTVIGSSTRGIVGPKGIPQPILKKLQDTFLAVTKDPEYLERMDKAALASIVMVGDEYGKYLRDLHERVRGLMAALQTSKPAK